MKKDNFGLILDELDNVLDTLFIFNKQEVLPSTNEKLTDNQAKNKEEKKSSKIQNKSIEKQTEDEVKLFSKQVSKKAKRTKVKVDYLSAPKKPTLQHYRAWEKSFKPLKLMQEDKRKKELDIEKSVEWIAQTGIFQLIYKEKLKKSFTLTLLIDKHHSMDIFNSLIVEFSDMLKHYGVFKDVRYLYIDGEKEEGVFYKDRAFKQKVKSNSIVQETKNLILVLSSCISPTWRSNAMYQHINSWSKKNFCSIVQMLPSNMWLLTTLQDGNKLAWRSKKEYSKNAELSSIKELLFFNKESSILKVPVISFEHHSFKAWSSVVLGDSTRAISGIGFDVEKIKRIKVVDRKRLSPEERLDNFLSQASSTAKVLAAYLANNHVSFEIARIIQDLKLKDSSLAHIAEVFLGGIIEKQEDKEQISYDFYDGIRDVLKHNIAPTEALELYNQTSKFVSEHFNTAQKMPSMIQNPNSVKEIEWDDTMIAFAKIGIDILKRKGGIDYSKALAFEREILELEEEEIKAITPTTKRYQMGSDERKAEQPIHEVIINYDFEISPYLVTFEEYDIFCEDKEYLEENNLDIEKPNDEGWGREKRPVINVSWYDADAYCKWMSKKTQETYRLPTESEWEFACRANTTTKWYFGKDEKKLKDYAWYIDNSDRKTHPVGELKANEWGLYDMHGNVYEWCLDDYVDNYENIPRDGSEHQIEKKEYKILRGGSWVDNANFTRSANRSWNYPSFRNVVIGFRLLRTLP